MVEDLAVVVECVGVASAVGDEDDGDLAAWLVRGPVGDVRDKDPRALLERVEVHLRIEFDEERGRGTEGFGDLREG